MIDRRELLKLFGVGAAVVPIVGGAPLAAAEARLVEPAKVELHDNLDVLGAEDARLYGSSGKYRLTARFSQPGRKPAVFEADTYVFEVKNGVLYSHWAWNGDALLGERYLEYEIKGRCHPDETNRLFYGGERL
jgi:hypothetical protein